jgi:hypothetical protein
MQPLLEFIVFGGNVDKEEESVETIRLGGLGLWYGATPPGDPEDAIKGTIPAPSAARSRISLKRKLEAHAGGWVSVEEFCTTHQNCKELKTALQQLQQSRIQWMHVPNGGGLHWVSEKEESSYEMPVARPDRNANEWVDNPIEFAAMRTLLWTIGTLRDMGEISLALDLERHRKQAMESGRLIDLVSSPNHDPKVLQVMRETVGNPARKDHPKNTSPA